MTEPWTTVQREWMERDDETGMEWSAARLDFLRRMRGDGTMETGRHGQTSLLIFLLFFLHNVFFLSIIHGFPLCLCFPLYLLCEIVSGLRGVCCKGIEARYPQAILSTNAYIIHSFVFLILSMKLKLMKKWFGSCVTEIGVLGTQQQ